MSTGPISLMPAWPSPMLFNHQQGKLDDAITDYRDYLRDRPQDAGAHASLADALLARKDTDGARHEYEEAIRLQQTNAHYNLAVTLEAQGQLARARRELRPTCGFAPAPGCGAGAQALKGHERCTRFTAGALRCRIGARCQVSSVRSPVAG